MLLLEAGAAISPRKPHKFLPAGVGIDSFVEQAVLVTAGARRMQTELTADLWDLVWEECEMGEVELAKLVRGFHHDYPLLLAKLGPEE